MSLVPFIIRSEIDTHFVPSDVTERLVAVAQGVRALRARCKLSRWPRADVEQVHSEMQQMARAVVSLDNQNSKNSTIHTVLLIELAVLRKVCDWTCACEVLSNGANASVQDLSTAAIDDALEFARPLLHSSSTSKKTNVIEEEDDDEEDMEASEEDVQVLFSACSSLSRMISLISTETGGTFEDWMSVGALAPVILSNINAMKNPTTAFALRPTSE